MLSPSAVIALYSVMLANPRTAGSMAAVESDRLFYISSEILIENRGRAAGFHGGARRYTLTGDAARAIPSSLSSNSNPAVRGLWLRVYQR